MISVEKKIVDWQELCTPTHTKDLKVGQGLVYDLVAGYNADGRYRGETISTNTSKGPVS